MSCCFWRPFLASRRLFLIALLVDFHKGWTCSGRREGAADRLPISTRSAWRYQRDASFSKRSTNASGRLSRVLPAQRIPTTRPAKLNSTVGRTPHSVLAGFPLTDGASSTINRCGLVISLRRDQHGSLASLAGEFAIQLCPAC